METRTTARVVEFKKWEGVLIHGGYSMGIAPIDLDKLLNITPFEEKITAAIHEMMNEGFYPDKILLSERTRILINEITSNHEEGEIEKEVIKSSQEEEPIIVKRHHSLPQIPLVIPRKYFIPDLELESASLPDAIAIIVDTRHLGLQAMRVVTL